MSERLVGTDTVTRTPLAARRTRPPAVSMKVTVPPGVSTPAGTVATVAVKVTDWPDVIALAEALMVVEVAASTDTPPPVTAPEAPANPAAPTKVAMILW